MTPTPSLIIDLPTVERNITRMSDYLRDKPFKLRPHTKTHKSLKMAKLQLDAGANGLTVAKAGEAITMAEVCDDIFVAYPALDPWRREHLANLAKKITVRIAVDTPEAAEWIGQAARSAGSTIGAIVDLDMGFGRTGVQTAQDAVVLARLIARTPGLRFDGLMFYPGHFKYPLAIQAEKLIPIAAKLKEALDLLKRDGHEAKIVSGGSTPTATQSHLIPGQTEIRPGTYIFNDMSVVSCGYVGLDDCAARLTCTVVTTAVPGKFVLDSGSKSLTSDRRSVDPDTAGFGHVVEYPDAKISRLSEEHAECEIGPSGKSPKVGERVQVIPNHICPCVNLQTMAWLRDEAGNLEPLSIDARGQVW